jgi:hypothetical protein
MQQFLFICGVIIFSVFAIKALWISSVMLDDRKKAYRAGTHDYYGNKIEDKNEQ